MRVVKLVDNLSRTLVANTLGRQLLRSGTSVAANYRAACRARSLADFIAKMGIVEKEADGSAFWIEMLVETGQVREELVAELLSEAGQLTAIGV